MPSPPDLLVTPAQLSRYNVPSQFLSQFAPRPVVVQVVSGGALGAMTFAWQFVGDSVLSPTIASSAGATWAYTVDDAFVDLVFPAGTYAAGMTWTIDANGTITLSGGALAGLTAVFFDLRTTACSSATTEALTRMQNAIRQPLLTWGDDVRTHAAAMAYAILKRGRGSTPDPAGGAGDINIFMAEKLAIEFFDAIGRHGRPPSMTDSSVSTDGPLLAAYPTVDTLRGW